MQVTKLCENDIFIFQWKFIKIKKIKIDSRSFQDTRDNRIVVHHRLGVCVKRPKY